MPSNTVTAWGPDLRRRGPYRWLAVRDIAASCICRFALDVDRWAYVRVIEVRSCPWHTGKRMTG